MAKMNRPVPGLFGGVSQQTPAMRHETQCELQDNFLSTVAEGLCKRPGSYHIKEVEKVPASAAKSDGAFIHYMDYGPSERYELVMVDSTLEVYNLVSGVKATVTLTDTPTYPSSDDYWRYFRAITVADVTFVVNTDQTCAMTSATSTANPTNTAWFVISRAVQYATYKVTVDGNTGTANPTLVDVTPEQIVDALVTSVGTALGGGYTVTKAFPDVLKVKKNSGSLTSSDYSDSHGSALGVCLNDGVARFEQLPAKFVDPASDYFVVSVKAAAEDTDDDYYVKWNEAEQRWEECVGPGLNYELDRATLPARLTRTGLNAFTFARPDVWADRAAGNDDTNPLPSFIGSKIRDIFFHRNRLGFLTAAGTVVMSRSGDYVGFFSPTARTALATDPIDLEAVDAEKVELRWAVAIEKELLVFGEKQQFAIVGGDILTAETATVPKVASYESSPDVRPVTMGERLVFAVPAGSWLQIKMLQLKDFSDTKWEAIDLTEHVPQYIPTGARALAASSVAKALVVSQQSSNTMYVLKYEDGDNRSLRQKAWQKWALNEKQGANSTTRVVGAAFAQDTLYFACSWTSSSTRRLYLSYSTLRGEPAELLGQTPFEIKLDRKATATAVYSETPHTTDITVPYALTAATISSLVILKATSSSTADPAVIAVAPTSVTYNATNTVLTFAGDQSGTYLVAGFRAPARYRFSEYFLKDSNGVPIDAAELRLQTLLLRLVRSGYCEVQVTPHLRDTYTYPFSGRVVGVPGLGLGQSPCSSQVVKAKVGAEPYGTLVDIYTESHYPAIVPYAEWVVSAHIRSTRG